MEGVESGVIDVLTDVPQGSVLGPLLLLIYIDDISKLQFTAGCILHLYADDVIVQESGFFQ